MSGNTPSPSSLRFDYVFVVWGTEYADLMLHVALPCLLAPGNLPGLANIRESRLLFITTSADRQRIESAPVLAKLKEVIQTEFIEPAWIDDRIPYWLKAARGHQLAARMTAERGGYCVYLAPDFLLSDGTLRSLVKLAAAGKEAVLTTGIRVTTETIVSELRSSNLMAPNRPIAIGSRELVRVCLKHVHPEDQRYNWDHDQFSVCPVVCTWNVPGEEGLLVRAFHLHPLLVKMSNTESAELLDRNTIDAEFLGLNCPSWDAIHVETDSDNIALFSLTAGRDRLRSWETNAASVDQLRKLAYSGVVNALHRHYFTKAIKLHCEDLNEKWTAVEHRSGLIAYRTLTLHISPGVANSREAAATTADVMRFIPARVMAREVVRRARRRIALETANAIGRLLRRPEIMSKPTNQGGKGS